MAARRKPAAVKPSVEGTKYVALADLSYNDKRVKAGEVVTDIPKESVSWLLEGNYIEKAD